MSDIQTCPHCHQDIPRVLFEAHVEACDENEDTESAGALLIRPDDEDSDSEVNISAPLLHPSQVNNGDADDMFSDMQFEVESEVDDEFRKLVGQLDITPAIVDVNVTTIDDLELSKRFSEVKQELLDRGEMMEATTQTGRDLQSHRAAYLIELRRRGLS